MTNEAVKPVSVLSFPIQDKSIVDCTCDAEIFLQSRITAIRLINRIVAGVHKVTEKDRQYIHDLNELFRKYNQPVLEFNF